MKRLREAPTRSGSPNDPSSGRRAMAVTLCPSVLPKPIPGSSTMLWRAMPARAAMSSEREKNAQISAMISIDGSAASRLCMMITGTACSATTRASPPSRCRPHTSLTMAAPAASAQAATSALMVSMETGMPSATTAGRTGARRRISSAIGTATAPPYGRVDSAPISSTSAPSAIIRVAWSMAAVGSRKRPPSEKESGVTLSTPITIGRPSASRRASRSGDFFSSRAEPATGRTSVMAVALRRSQEGCQAPTPARGLALSIRDFLGQLPGVLDPAHHQLLGGKKANQLSLLVGLGHGFGKAGGVAISQFFHGLDADRAQQPSIFPAHAFDAQLVGDIGPAQEPLLIEFGLGGEEFASFRTFRGLEQLLRRSDANRFKRLGVIRIEIFDGGDRVGHRILLAPDQPPSPSNMRRTGQGRGPRRRSRRLRDDANGLFRGRAVDANRGDETSDEVVHVPLTSPALSAG